MTTYPTPCPQPVDPTVESTVQYWTDGEVSVTITDTDDPLVQTVTIQVADPGYWLLSVWFIDGDTITATVSLTPPTVPGSASFHNITDSAGKLEFTMSNDGTPWGGRICAVVVGTVNRSDAIVLGVTA